MPNCGISVWPTRTWIGMLRMRAGGPDPPPRSLIAPPSLSERSSHASKAHCGFRSTRCAGPYLAGLSCRQKPGYQRQGTRKATSRSWKRRLVSPRVAQAGDNRGAHRNVWAFPRRGMCSRRHCDAPVLHEFLHRLRARVLADGSTGLGHWERSFS